MINLQGCCIMSIGKGQIIQTTWLIKQNLSYGLSDSKAYNIFMSLSYDVDKDKIIKSGTGFKIMLFDQ